jgi:hypothetical protein
MARRSGKEKWPGKKMTPIDRDHVAALLRRRPEAFSVVDVLTAAVRVTRPMPEIEPVPYRSRRSVYLEATRGLQAALERVAANDKEAQLFEENSARPVVQSDEQAERHEEHPRQESSDYYRPDSQWPQIGPGRD